MTQLDAVLLNIGGGGGAAWGPVLFSNNRIRALALVGLLFSPPPRVLPAVLTGLSGRGYRDACGTGLLGPVWPGRRDSGKAAGEIDRDGNPLRPRVVGVVGLLGLGDSGSVRSLTTVNLSTLTSERSRGRGVVWLLEVVESWGEVKAVTASDSDPPLLAGGEGGGGVLGLSSDREGPDPSKSRVEKTLS